LQTFTNFEVLVFDDNSPNNLFNQDSQFIYNLVVNSDPRFFYKKQNTNTGVSAVRNLGIDNSRGKFLIFLDSDDYWDINHLQNIYNFIENLCLTTAELGYTYFQTVDAKVIRPNNPDVTSQNIENFVETSEIMIQNIPRSWNYSKELVYFSCTMPLLIWPRAFIDRLRFNPEFHLGEEPEFMARKFIELAKTKLKINRFLIDSETVFYRKHKNSLSNSTIAKQKESQNYIKIYQTLLSKNYLNFQQKLLCKLGIIRYSLLVKTDLLSKLIKKILTFTAKIVSFWWF